MKKIAFLFASLMLFPLLINSQSLEEKKFEFSLSGGLFLPGEVSASYESDFPPDLSVSIKNSFSPLLKLVADYYVTPGLSAGINLNFSKFLINDIQYKGQSLASGNEVSLGTWDGVNHIIRLDDITMLEINGSIKWRFILNEKMVLKPCLYIGYRRTFSESPWSRENGVVLNYNLEFQYYLTSNYYFLSDLGFFAQPYGGVHHIGYVRTAGVPYLTFGLGVAL